MNNQWPTFQANPARTGESKERISPPLKKVWEFELQNQLVSSSPVVSNGIVYIGTRSLKDWSGTFFALDSNSGRLFWKFDSDGPILSTASMGNGMVYFRSENNILHALDAVSGEKRWELKHGDVAYPGVSLLVVGGLLFMHTDKIYILNAVSGQTLGEFIAKPENSGASPAVYETTAYFGLGYSFIALDLRTKKILWQTETPLSSKATLGPVVKDGVVYGGSMSGYLMAINATNGKVLWTTKLPVDPEGHSDTFLKSYPAISHNNLYIGAPDGKVYALNARTGKFIWGWKFDMGGYVATSPIVSGDVVYILSSNGVFYALNVRTGKKIWEYKSAINFYDIRSSPAICDEKLFIGWDKVYAFSK